MEITDISEISALGLIASASDEDVQLLNGEPSTSSQRNVRNLENWKAKKYSKRKRKLLSW